MFELFKAKIDMFFLGALLLILLTVYSIFVLTGVGETNIMTIRDGIKELIFGIAVLAGIRRAMGNGNGGTR